MTLPVLISYWFTKDSFITDAYTTKYYEEAPINVLYESVDYTLDNCQELEKLIQIFADNALMMDIVLRNNKKELLKLLRSIFVDGAKDILVQLDEDKEVKIRSIIYNELFDIEINKDTDIAYELSKKLKHVKSL